MKTMFFIRENLAVCGYDGIGRPESFQQWGFSAHLQCAGNFDSWINQICEVKALPFPDGFPIPPDTFMEAMEWLQLKRQAQAKILVSCAAGQSRSVTLAAAFLSLTEQLPFVVAVKEVFAAIPGAYPHPMVLVSASVYCEESLSFTQLKALYESARSQPVFPWSNELLNQALKVFHSGIVNIGSVWLRTHVLQAKL